MSDRSRTAWSLSRRSFLAAGTAAALAGCTGIADDVSPFGDGSADESTADADLSFLEKPDVPLANSLSAYADAAANSSADKDAIPAIDEPTIANADAGEVTPHEDSVVFGLEIGGEARAYPQRVLVWHEIVNDTLGGTNVAVTYCPLTGTVLGFERDDVRFGVEGWLINSNLILFDRETDSWWPQVLGTAVDGPLEGYSLPERRIVWTTWGRWREIHPESTVLTEDTGYARNYGRDPYAESGYNVSDSVAYPVMTEDDTFHSKRIVMGARTADGAVAFDKERLREDRLLSTTLDETPYLAVYDEPLDTARVYRDADVETVDTDGDRYALDGTSYAADELPLESVNTFDAMWFAWYAFYPETEVVG